MQNITLSIVKQRNGRLYPHYLQVAQRLASGPFFKMDTVFRPHCSVIPICFRDLTPRLSHCFAYCSSA